MYGGSQSVPFRALLDGARDVPADGGFAHPFFAITKSDGSFEIPLLVPGQYTFKAWHERLGEKDIKVTLGENKVTEIEIVFEEAQSKNAP